MALGKSIKMYLTIFIATTCIYMVLYQYHISRQPLTSPEVMKNKDISDELSSSSSSSNTGNGRTSTSSSSLVKRYNLFLWSPMSLLTTASASSATSSTSSSSSSSSSASSSSSSSSQKVAPIATSSSSSSATSSSLSSNASLSTHNKTLVTHNVVPISSDKVNSVHYNNNNNNNKSVVEMPKIGLNATTAALTSASSATATTTTTKNKTNSTTRTINTTSTTTTTTATSIITSSTKLPTPTTSSNKTNTKKPTTASTKFTKPFAPDVASPPLYIITPTYRRAEQLAELTRLGYTLKHVVNLMWLVIEDANKTSELVTQTLNRIGVPFQYFVAPMPEEYKKKKTAKPRGVSNRNRGLEWLRANATEGVFYFADDDNTYDISIFEQMRYTKKVSMWPVGLVTKYGVSSPIIRNGLIDGFYDGWIGGRKYPVDMAGFAVSVKFLHERPTAKMPFKPGYEEDGFLKSLAPLNNTEIELLASDCTEILTWHTQTKKNAPADALNMTKYRNTNLVLIDKTLVRP